jgi:hypothetical protein
MLRTRPVAAAVLALLSLAGAAHADVITFDDIALGSGSNQALADGYQGFNWDQVFAHDPGSVHAGSGHETANVSGENVAFNANALTAAIDNSTFTFNEPVTQVVPLPPAALLGLGLMGGIGAIRRLRRRA